MEKKKSNILITGYSGFVGHSLIPLLSQNYNIIGIDNLSLSTKQEAEQLNSYLLNNYITAYVFSFLSLIMTTHD